MWGPVVFEGLELAPEGFSCLRKGAKFPVSCQAEEVELRACCILGIAEPVSFWRTSWNAGSRVTLAVLRFKEHSRGMGSEVVVSGAREPPTPMR